VPRITLVGAPLASQNGGRVIDYEAGVSLALGESTDVDVATVARLRDLESLGFSFKVDQENAPAGEAGDSTTPPPNPAAFEASTTAR